MFELNYGIHNKASSGIYKITNMLNNRFYIGRTVNFQRRWNLHRSALTNQVHRNTFMQNDFNKHPDAIFRFEILEIVLEQSLLSQTEQTYLDKFYDNQNQCYNIEKNGNPFMDFSVEIIIKKRQTSNSRCLNKTHTKKFKLISPEGVVVEGLNLSNFARENNLPIENLNPVTLGKRDNCLGWRQYKEDVPVTPHTFYKREKEFKIISPQGEIHTGLNLSEFANKLDLNRMSLYGVVSGRLLSYKGWRPFRTEFVGVPYVKVPRITSVPYNIISPDGKIYHGVDIQKLSKEIGLNRTSLTRLVKGKINSFNGWTRFTEPRI